jgi:hypothetical protein
MATGIGISIRYPYVWLCCSFAAIGACLYGYEGVYFTGVSTLGMCPLGITLWRKSSP